MTFWGRDCRLLIRDNGALLQLWLLPVLVLFVAGLFVTAEKLSTDVMTLITLLTLLMVTLPLAARLWHDDLYSGVLEQVALSPRGLLGLVIIRWLTLYGLVYVPVVILMLTAQAVWLDQLLGVTMLLACLLLSACMLALTLLVGALTVSLRQGGLLVALLLVPFLLPVFIAFAAVPAVPAALYLLAAAVVLALPLCCLATAHVLRQQLCV